MTDQTETDVDGGAIDEADVRRSRSPTRSSRFLLALRAIAREGNGAPGGVAAAARGQPGAARRRPARRPARLRSRARSTSPTSAPSPTSTSMRLRLAELLDSVDTYSYVFDPYVPEVVASQLSDDLTSDRHRPRQRPAPLPGRRRRRGAVVVAVLLRPNWGNLASAALSALLSVVAHDRLDADFEDEAEEIEAADEMLGSRPRSLTAAPEACAAAVECPLGRTPRRLRHRSTTDHEEAAVGIVVQKYGGSSVADADAHQARRPADRRDQEGRPRRRRRRLGHGRHHRRAARPRRAGQPAAARPRARHAAHRRRADLDGAARDGDRRPRLHGPVVHRLARPA